MLDSFGLKQNLNNSIFSAKGQYLKNQCSIGDSSCLPCPSRLPSCLTLPDGANAYPGRKQSPNYIVCDRNRTLAVKTCPTGYFDKASRTCLQPGTTPCEY